MVVSAPVAITITTAAAPGPRCSAHHCGGPHHLHSIVPQMRPEAPELLLPGAAAYTHAKPRTCFWKVVEVATSSSVLCDTQRHPPPPQQQQQQLSRLPGLLTHHQIGPLSGQQGPLIDGISKESFSNWINSVYQKCSLLVIRAQDGCLR